MADQKITQLNENTAPASGDLYVIVDDPSGSPESQKIDHDNLFTNIEMLNLRDPTELTIASGEITVTQSYHTIDTEGDAASDDLDTINGGAIGDILILRSADGSRDPTIKDLTGNIHSAGDFVLTQTVDTIVLLFNGVWIELSRSNNA